MKDFLKKNWFFCLWLIFGTYSAYGLAGLHKPTWSEYGVQVCAYLSAWTVFMGIYVGVKIAIKGAVALFKEWRAAPTPGDEETGDDPEYDAACAWRAIDLATGEGWEHYESCYDLYAIRKAGWHVERSGHRRGGFVYIKLIAPGHKE